MILLNIDHFLSIWFTVITFDYFRSINADQYGSVRTNFDRSRQNRSQSSSIIVKSDHSE